MPDRLGVPSADSAARSTATRASFPRGRVTRLLVLLVAVVIGAAFTVPPPAAAARTQPKVVVIVGPAGELTSEYRSIGASAAAEAARWTPNVVAIYSPNATWSVVKEALQGASVVIYLGHGNGWPSRYRSSPWPYSQNGLGLNPVAGGGDHAHQYFGEYYLAREVRLAKNAVVLMHRLCYASGNTEPGLPEGTLDQARQRVDNYAAGWISSGAGTVIADAFAPPAGYVRALFATPRRTTGQMWRESPTANGHTRSFGSVRSPGFTALLDPDRASSGFYRSLVTRTGSLPRELAAADGTPAPGPVAQPVAPAAPRPVNLAERGFRFGTPTLARAPIANGTVGLAVPFSGAAASELPQGIKLAVRWDRLAVDAQPPPGTPSGGSASGTGAPDPSAAASASPRPDAAAREPAAPDAPAFIQSEKLGDAVLTEPAKVTARAIVGRLSVPAAPGLYRLSIMLTDHDGVPLASDRRLRTGQIVRVSPPLSAAYGLDMYLSLAPASRFSLPVVVANTGAQSWEVAAPPQAPQGPPPPALPGFPPPAAPKPAAKVVRARLVVQWVSLAGASVAAPPGSSVSIRVRPGAQARAALSLTAPAAPGEYALLVDVVTGDGRSLAAAGVPVGFIRVTVRTNAPESARPALTDVPVTPTPTPGMPTPGAPSRSDPAPADPALQR